MDISQRLLGARSVWILLYDSTSKALVTAEARGVGAEPYRHARICAERGIVGLSFTRREPVFVPEPGEDDRWFDCERVHRAHLAPVVTVPICVDDEALGVIGLEMPCFSRDDPPTSDDLARFRAVASVAGCSLRHTRSLHAVEEDRQRLRRVLEERRYLKSQVGQLREELREWHSPESMIGESAIFRDVLTQVELVAPADSTVLLVGETGTGKERIARALHDQSRRSGRPFVAVNCAALPETLVESELFGYEKGAFTGAVGRKPGKFELADLGTLFLDEIGDLPEQAQAKLLRVLQEREVQRVGGTRPVPVNVRLISATNQDLASGIRTGRFRQDLYYRLSVFPIRVPPLRERREDIPLLVGHFIRRFAERQHRPLPRLADGVVERLMTYEWPGNIRELQNVIERAVILARGEVIGSELIVLHSDASEAVASALQAVPTPESPRERPNTNVIRFADAERHAIARALDLAMWRISGHGGAADILGLKPTTLHAKMKRLGIRRPRFSEAGSGTAVSGHTV
jgi:transcriptional regulator with GAF, ATPase, and Fis domain